MSENLVLLAVDGPIATLTLNRPKQLNALNQELLEELSHHVDELAARTDVRVVLLVGEGRAFAAGADIAQMQALSPAAAEDFARFGQEVLAKLERLPQPTIALVQGYVLGGGMELAMACDVRIAAEGTQFAQPEVALGVTPGFGGSQRLPRIVGQGRALHLLLSGERIDAQEAYRIGLVTLVVAPDELLAAGKAWAGKLTRLAPQALKWVKREVYEGAETDLAKGLAYEATLFGLCFSTRDQKEGMTAFLEKRAYDFQGE